ncbi:MAG: cation:proton antiporter [Acutalibacteraceae bacterium]|nr:cation:proton antiporter [Acutalibacteraceae bacterium]
MDTLTTMEISKTFLALFLLLFFSFIGGKLFEYIKAPKVVGEITGGMILGGSCIGLLFPDFFSSVFSAYESEGKVLNIFYQLGLVSLMFSSGYNTSISITKKNAKNYFLLFFGATIIPMSLSLIFIKLFEQYFIGTANNSISFGLVFAISTAITSIPVISKIFFDIGMMNTKFSNMVLTVSTLQDLCLWILLNLSISLIETGELNIFKLLTTTTITIGLLVCVKAFELIIRKAKITISSNALPISFLVLFLTIYLLSKLNINIMYSAFIGGYMMKAILSEENKEIDKIKDFAMNLFVPIYFALVGIQLDVIHNFSLIRFTLFFIIAFSLEFIGTVCVMWFTNLKKKTVLSLGITMNARGGPGIVLATTAFAYNIINIEFFTVLILTTMLSSTIAGYWLRRFKNQIQNDG